MEKELNPDEEDPFKKFQTLEGKEAEKKKRKEKIKLPETFAHHAQKDSDVDFTEAILLMRHEELSGIRIEDSLKKMKFLSLKNGDGYTVSIKNGNFVDRGRKDYDHHGTGESSSFDMAVKKLGLAEEEWLLTVRKIIYNAERKGLSNPFDCNEVSKVIGRSNLSEKEKSELGIKAAYLVLLFHKQGIERNTDLTRELLKDFFDKKKIKTPERFRRYYNQLGKENFQRPCDLCEILSSSLQKYGEKATQELGETLMELLYGSFLKYRKAQNSVEDYKRIGIGGGHFIMVIDAFSKEILLNEKSHVVALKCGAMAVVQKNKTKQVQIFFNKAAVTKEMTDKIVHDLRKLEVMKQNREFPKDRESMNNEGSILECPEWYYFLGDAQSDGKRGIFIFNGSLTAPDVPPTQIKLDAIVTIVAETLKGFEEKKA